MLKNILISTAIVSASLGVASQTMAHDVQKPCGVALGQCTKIGQKLVLKLNTKTPSGWMVSGQPSVNKQNSAWHNGSGKFNWIGPASGNVYNKTLTYSTNFSIAEDPYFYQALKLKLGVGGDNSVRSIRLNGTVIYTGSNDNRDFDAGNFAYFTRHANNVGGPFRKGCNTLEIDVYNSGGPTGMTVNGLVEAQCTKCISPKPRPVDTPTPRR